MGLKCYNNNDDDDDDTCYFYSIFLKHSYKVLKWQHENISECIKREEKRQNDD